MLRGGVVGREHAQRGAGQWFLAEGLIGKRFGDAEIKQFRSAIGGNNNIAGLDVAMRNEIAMRVRDRLCDLHEHRDTLIHIQPFAVTGAVDRFALDIFHDQIRPALRVTAAVQQPGDTFVIQRRQDLPLLLEAAQEFIGVGACAQQFHRALLHGRAPAAAVHPALRGD